MYLNKLAIVSLLLGVAGSASADIITVVSGTVQGSVVLDAGFNVLGFDVRTPGAGDQATVQDTAGDQAILTDLNLPFPNLNLLGQDVPAAQGTFALTFVESSLALISPTELLVNVQGTLISGTPNAIDQDFLGTAIFDFSPNSLTPIAGTTASLLSSTLVAISTPTPEPTAVPLLLAGVAALIVFRKRTTA